MWNGLTRGSVTLVMGDQFEQQDQGAELPPVPQHCRGVQAGHPSSAVLPRDGPVAAESSGRAGITPLLQTRAGQGDFAASGEDGNHLGSGCSLRCLLASLQLQCEDALCLSPSSPGPAAAIVSGLTIALFLPSPPFPENVGFLFLHFDLTNF